MGTEEEILLAVDGGDGLLDQDNIPNENQSLTCFSCGTRMRGLYCHECGNKNDNYRRSVFSLLIELIQNLTAVDSRMWRSLRSMLFRPGRMAREFADGARSRWTSPVRFYIAASILLFGYITISQTQILAVGSLHEEQRTPILNIGPEDQKITPRVHFFIRKDQMDAPEDGRVFGDLNGSAFGFGFGNNDDGDSIEEMTATIDSLNAQIETASTQIERSALIATRNEMERMRQAMERNDTAQPPQPDSADGDSVAPEVPEIMEDDSNRTLNITGLNGEQVSLDREGMRALLDLMLRRPELFNSRVNDGLKLAMFFMMPLAMLMGAIFIRGRQKAMLYDHLVHAAYIHAFSFVLLLVFILLHQFTDLTLLIVPYTITLLIYLPLSAKGMFQRGWFKSVLTAYGVGAVYSLVMLLVFIGIVAQAVIAVAADLSDQQERLAAAAERSSAAAPLAGTPQPPTVTVQSSPDETESPADGPE